MENLEAMSVPELRSELERLEAELDYQVHHKRIAELQTSIDAIEAEIRRRAEKE